MLPPLVHGQSVGPTNGAPSSNYQQYGYRPSKLRSLNNKPYMGNNGLSGEKIKLNHHDSNEKLPVYQGSYMSPNPAQRDQ